MCSLIVVLGGVGRLRSGDRRAARVGLVVGLASAYASEWSPKSMHRLDIAVATLCVRSRLGKRSALDANTEDSG